MLVHCCSWPVCLRHAIDSGGRTLGSLDRGGARWGALAGPSDPGRHHADNPYPVAKWAQAEDPTGPSDPLEGLIGDGFRQLGEAEDADAVRKLIGAIREGGRAGREALKLTRRKLIEGDPKPGDVARLQAVQRALARADPRPRARVRLPAVSHIGGAPRGCHSMKASSSFAM